MATPIPPNRATFTLAEVAAAAGGELHAADGAALAVGVSTDSRALDSGALFVALRGENHDGHRYLGAARQRGAAACLVARDSGDEGARIEVADTLAALGSLARHFVERESGGRELPTLAIGGAAGKTTTKTLAHAAVSALFGPTLVTLGNLNNLVGVPMTLFTLTPEHRALVIECGTSSPGEIARLGQIVRPQVALVLNVDIEHSQGLGGLEAIADEEAALLVAARRVAVTGAEEPLLLARARDISARLVTFGSGREADVRLVRREISSNGTSRLAIALPAGSCASATPDLIEVTTPLLGAAAALNVTAAVAAAAALADDPLDAEALRQMAEALATVSPVVGRFSPHRCGQLLILDDTYNSNPRSLRAALAAAREVADRLELPLVLALGDMLELGTLAQDSHRAALTAALATRPALVVGVGPETRGAVESLGLAGDSVDRGELIEVFDDSAAAAERIAELVPAAAVVLVKGSRGIRMERLVEALVGEPVAAR